MSIRGRPNHRYYATTNGHEFARIDKSLSIAIGFPACCPSRAGSSSRKQNEGFVRIREIRGNPSPTLPERLHSGGGADDRIVGK